MAEHDDEMEERVDEALETGSRVMRPAEWGRWERGIGGVLMRARHRGSPARDQKSRVDTRQTPARRVSASPGDRAESAEAEAEPTGETTCRLVSCLEGIEGVGAAASELVAGWTATVEERQGGGSRGTKRYTSPSGVPYRSQADVARSLDFQGPLSPSRRRGGRSSRGPRARKKNEKPRVLSKKPKERSWAGAVKGGTIFRPERTSTSQSYFARLGLGGLLLPSSFETAARAEAALEACAPLQRCVCGTSSGPDDEYIVCAAGPTGRCGGLVHPRCVGFASRSDAPSTFACPLDRPGVASTLSAVDDDQETHHPLVGRMLLHAPEQRPDVPADACGVCRDATVAEGGGPMENVLVCDMCCVDVHFACSGLARAPAWDVIFQCSACRDVAETPSLLRAFGADETHVFCSSLVLEDLAVYRLAPDAARDAAARKAKAEELALSGAFANRGKFTFASSTPNCGDCHHCRNMRQFGGSGSLKRACLAKDDERNKALLYLVSGRQPPRGGKWTAHSGIGGAPRDATPRPHRRTGHGIVARGELLGRMRADGWTIIEKARPTVKTHVDRYYRPPGNGPQLRSLTEVARSAYPEHLTRDDRGDSDDGGAPRALKKPRVEAPEVEATNCAICLSMIHDDEHVLDCDHGFHSTCIKSLAGAVRLASRTRLSAAISCPLCRRVSRSALPP